VSAHVVVKLGGTTLAEQGSVLHEIATRAPRGGIVVVHGGGKRLTDWLARLGVMSRFQDGLRVTDDAALEVALAVLRGVVNVELVATLRSLGADAIGLSGVDGGLLRSRRVPELGRVATVTGVRDDLLRTLIAQGSLPVIAPLALDEEGFVCNVNADDAAAGLAGALGARLVLLTDTDGIRGADGQRIASLTADESEALIEGGVIAGGMVPKVRCALRALAWGSPGVVIGDGGATDAIGRALDDPGFGTRWTSRAAPHRAAPHRASSAPE
jgi:acetylglutamate kinase